MEFENVQEYLFKNGYLDGSHSKSDIAKVKQEWKKKYQKAYQRKYKKENYRKEIVFKKEEWKLIQQGAKNHNQETKISPFLKECIFAYLNQCFVLPDDELVQSTEIEIRRVGVLLNQIARHINTSRTISFEQMEEVKKLLFNLDIFVHETLRTPKTIENLLDEAVDNDPQILNYLEQLIANKKQNLK